MRPIKRTNPTILESLEIPELHGQMFANTAVLLGKDKHEKTDGSYQNLLQNSNNGNEPEFSKKLFSKHLFNNDLDWDELDSKVYAIWENEQMKDRELVHLRDLVSCPEKERTSYKKKVCRNLQLVKGVLYFVVSRAGKFCRRLYAPKTWKELCVQNSMISRWQVILVFTKC